MRFVINLQMQVGCIDTIIWCDRMRRLPRPDRDGRRRQGAPTVPLPGHPFSSACPVCSILPPALRSYGGGDQSNRPCAQAARCQRAGAPPEVCAQYEAANEADDEVDAWMRHVAQLEAQLRRTCPGATDAETRDMLDGLAAVDETEGHEESDDDWGSSCGAAVVR